MKDDLNDARLQGIAVGLAELMRLHGSEVEVADVLRGFGIGEAELKAAGVSSEDLKALRPALELERYREATASQLRHRGRCEAVQGPETSRQAKFREGI